MTKLNNAVKAFAGVVALVGVIGWGAAANAHHLYKITTGKIVKAPAPAPVPVNK